MKTISEFNILEIVFIKSPNAKLVRESVDFIHAEVMANQLTSEIVPLIWHCYTSNHLCYLVNGKEIKEAVLEVIASIARYVPYSVCLLYTSPSPRDLSTSRMPSSACKKKISYYPHLLFF
eukprot:TRINITY_DN16064_c0_g1_i2.p1 TRINITY_DN16064_c0_g1~~TRINITY_DN16064_c0_g1_i2.p1  ORF type:complete len:120 (-),score=12.53 TRINITY_DN16064_c0_g1_i2:2-361(-)